MKALITGGAGFIGSHLADSNSEKKFVSYEEAYGRAIDDMMRRVPDTSRIKKIIGWEHKTGLDEMLGLIIESFK